MHTHSWCGLFWRKGLLWTLASWSFFSIVIIVQKNIHYTTHESYVLWKLFSHSSRTNKKLKLLLKYYFKIIVKSQTLWSCICAFLYLGSYNSAKNFNFFEAISLLWLWSEHQYSYFSLPEIITAQWGCLFYVSITTVDMNLTLLWLSSSSPPPTH